MPPTPARPNGGRGPPLASSAQPAARWFQIPLQHSLWPYVADFACLEAKLIVELDGGQHSEAKDARRTAFLEAQGFRILRFWNHGVLENLEGVLMVVSDALADSRE